jgi:hypothetical protein
MLWLLLLRSTYTAWSGWQTYDRPFTCRHCRLEVVARIVSNARHVARAGLFDVPDRAAAHAAAEAKAYDDGMRALTCAPCPRCHRFSADAAAVVDAQLRARTRTTSIQAYVSMMAGLLVGLGVAMLAFAIVSRPLVLLPAAGAGALAWGMVSLFLGPPLFAPRLAAPANVAFWLAPDEGGDARWVPAAEATPDAGPPPRPEEKVANTRNLAGWAAGLGASAFGIGLFLLFALTSQLHVANATGRDLVIRIDGDVVGRVHAGPRWAGEDIAADHFNIPAAHHVVEAVDGKGVVVARADVEMGNGEYLFAPGADGTAADVCFAVETTEYGSVLHRANPPSLQALKRGAVVWRVPVQTDVNNWREPSGSVSLRKGETWKQVNTLRAFVCPESGELTTESAPYASR